MRSRASAPRRPAVSGHSRRSLPECFNADAESSLKLNLNQHDRRVIFDDLGRVPALDRESRSPVIQFYSPVDNIGNYLPLLGIQKMLDHCPDKWSMHDRKVDTSFINDNYACGIIGGAGMLHPCFEHFWERLANEIQIPLIVWGVGACVEDRSVKSVSRPTCVSSRIVQKVFARCELINLRDELSVATTLGKPDHRISIAACPTIVHLADEPIGARDTLLYSDHAELVERSEHQVLHASLRRSFPGVQYTDNIQRPRHGLDDVLRMYASANCVVTTRLHGAITAYGLGIPYVAIPRDEKIRDFARIYGNGVLCEDVANVIQSVEDARRMTSLIADIAPVKEFGMRAKEWVSRHAHI